MNVWSALVLVAMCAVIAFTVWMTNSWIPTIFLTTVVWFGEAILRKGPRQI